MSPSPTAADFHTPLQTPSALTADQSQQLKKRKKKPKKKKTSTAIKMFATNITEADSEPEPFSEQLSQIENLRTPADSPTHGGMSYYQSRNQKTDKSDDIASQEVKVSDKKVPDSTVSKVFAFAKTANLTSPRKTTSR